MSFLKFLSLRWNQQRNFGVDGFISKISVARSLSRYVEFGDGTSPDEYRLACPYPYRLVSTVIM